MWYTNIYSNIIAYQKYIGTSIKVVCATHSLYASSGPHAEGVLSKIEKVPRGIRGEKSSKD